MSSPMITITRSASSTSLSSTMSISASPSSPKYIPVHRRTPSSGSSVASSSSRPSSPMDTEFKSHSETPSPTPGVYSFEALLALRPVADESMKEKIREACPEVAMNRRLKKSLQYLSAHPQARPQLNHDKPHNPRESQPEPVSIQSMPPAFGSTKHQQRALPRRTRSGRGPERRRSLLQDTWQGMRVTARQPLMVI